MEKRMIHHMSFGVRDTHRVAHVLAELIGGTALRAPTPPFPYGAWLVCFGDDYGSFLEIVPATTVFDPDAPLAVRQQAPRTELGNAHLLVSSPLRAETICAAAAREGWRVQEVETGLFRIVKLWIEDHLLVEFLAAGEAQRYVDAFGAAGMASLDGKLRDLESNLGKMLAQKLPPQVLEEALGAPM
jgi:hypothetical protein